MCFEHRQLLSDIIKSIAPFVSLFSSIMLSFCCPCIVRCVDFHNNMVDLPGTLFLKKISLPLSTVLTWYWLLRKQGNFIPNSPLLEEILSELSLHRTYILYRNHCDFICADILLYLEDSVPLYSSFSLG